MEWSNVILLLVVTVQLARCDSPQSDKLNLIENCKSLRQECLKSCKDVSNCTAKCPVCPIVTKFDPVPVSSLPRQGMIHRNFIVDSVNGSSQHFGVDHPVVANHTTIIKLSNFINNTNHVNIPTQLNSTNVNNINIFANRTEEGLFGLGESKTGPCCFVVEPKTCNFASDGLRCHHRRRKTCGPQCTSKVVHLSEHFRGRTSTPCHYTPIWPYINCASSHGFQEDFRYGRMYERNPIVGPYPFYQPNPCYFYNNCGQDSSFEVQDAPSNSEEATNRILSDDDEVVGANSTDWGVILKNCKVISSNDTVTIENCEEVTKENPYAASPVQRVQRSPSYSAMYPPPMPPAMSFYNPVPGYFNVRSDRVQRPKTRRPKRKLRKGRKSNVKAQ